ncbi:MAG: ATP-binding protein [Chlorobiota bacterium]|nr:ATP-binding protein [Chlorobiota bacterium]QQS66097.1 MAG: ATP-binding protein [Chlorobiota bacterium]
MRKILDSQIKCILIFTFIIFNFFSVNSLLSQIFPNEKLIPNGDKYIGLFSQSSFSQIRVYDKNFKFLNSVQYQKLFPLVYSKDIILSDIGGKCQIFKIQIKPEISIKPIKHLEINVCNNILDYNSGLITICGDSGIFCFDTSGNEVWSNKFFLNEAIFSLKEKCIYSISNLKNSILIKKLSSVDGKLLDESELVGSRHAKLIPDFNSDKIIVVTKYPNTINILDSKKLVLTDNIKIDFDYISTFLLNIKEKLVPSFLSSSYPKPLIKFIEDNSIRNLDFDYVLQGTVTSGSTNNNYLTLSTSDSTLVYNTNLDLLGEYNLILSDNCEFYEIDSNRIILASNKGSIVFSSIFKPQNWFSKYWRKIISYSLLIVLFFVLLSGYIQFRKIKIIYENLVNVPESGGILILSKSQKLKSINSSGLKRLMLSENTPLNKHVYTYFSNSDLSIINKSLKSLFLEGIPFESKVILAKNTDTQTLVFRGRNIINKLGFSIGYVVIVEDISKTIENERLINWVSVAHHIAHGMKTPLGAIKNSAETLLKLQNSNSNFNSPIQRIITQSEKLKSIVYDLISVAKTDELKLNVANLKLLFASIVSEYDEILNDNINIQLTYPDYDLYFNLDVEQFSIAINNLIDNCIQAIGERQSGKINIQLSKYESVLNIVIEDNGKGMNDFTLKNIFQPFYTEREGGSGIGMVIVKRVVESHKGTIEVQSKLGFGSKFIINLFE